MRQHSAIRDAIEYGLASLALNSLAYTPLRVSNFLARGYVRALDLALPRLRGVAMGNLAMALPQTVPRGRTRIVDGVFRSIARLLVAFARFPRVDRANIGRWIRRLLFYEAPPWAFTAAYVAWALATLATLRLVPPRRKAG